MLLAKPAETNSYLLKKPLMEKKMETTIIYWGYIGIMENKMEATIVYWGNIGIMEKKMETTIIYWGYLCEVPGCWSFSAFFLFLGDVEQGRPQKRGGRGGAK